MKKQYIKIGGKDYAPLLVGLGECCLNCDVKQNRCHWQCHYFEDNEEENVALKEVIHTPPPTKLQILVSKMKKYFMPIETDLPF